MYFYTPEFSASAQTSAVYLSVKFHDITCSTKICITNSALHDELKMIVRAWHCNGSRIYTRLQRMYARSWFKRVIFAHILRVSVYYVTYDELYLTVTRFVEFINKSSHYRLPCVYKRRSTSVDRPFHRISFRSFSPIKSLVNSCFKIPTGWSLVVHGFDLKVKTNRVPHEISIRISNLVSSLNWIFITIYIIFYTSFKVFIIVRFLFTKFQ